MTRPSPIPDAVVLAAVDRAERHRGRPGASVGLIFEHLGIPRRSRNARAQLGALVVFGHLRQFRAHGVEMWEITASGRTCLRRAASVELPESPQHRAWRNARTLAAREIDCFRGALRSAMVETTALLDGGASSDVWFELAERLRASARSLGSATYCLNEWAEPDDERPDIDDHRDPGDVALPPAERRRREVRRMGRRNTHLWAELKP